MPKEGDTVKGYVLVRKLGRGGQGTVFSAAHTYRIEKALAKTKDKRLERVNKAVSLFRAQQLEPDCAFKFIDRPDEKALSRAKEEVAAVQMLNDERIIKVFEFELDERPKFAELPWIRMEYVEGGNLKERADASEWRLDIPRSLRLFNEICEAVGLAHSLDKPVIHRDLKPENILLRVNGKPVVSDFGISVVLDKGRINLTSASEEVGARNFIAPELRGVPPEGKARPASDIYSLGKVLYYMLSGGRIRDREDHDKRAHDLRKWPGASSQMDYVYDRVFKRSICLYRNRFKAISELLPRLDEVMTLMEEHFYPGQEGRKCVMCGEGQYTGLSPAAAAWNATNVSPAVNHNPRVFICTKCGNMQSFLDPKILEKPGAKPKSGK